MSIDQVALRYNEIHSQFGKNENERTSYLFSLLLDATWKFKCAVELFSEKNHQLCRLFRHDLFSLIVVCSRSIDGIILDVPKTDEFKGCWVQFRKMIESVVSNSCILANDNVISIAQLLFLCALVFDSPDEVSADEIMSHPKARRIAGAFPASVGDIEFFQSITASFGGPSLSVPRLLLKLGHTLALYCKDQA